jgi:hypothetical protein
MTDEEIWKEVQELGLRGFYEEHSWDGGDIGEACLAVYEFFEEGNDRFKTT